MASGKTEEQRAQEQRDREAVERREAEQRQVPPSEEESTRVVELGDGEKEVSEEEKNASLKIYTDWLAKYKKSNPDFKEDENKFTIDGKGNGCISFKDPQAEEDFVRELAKKSPNGGISDKGIPIASFKDGELIDLRTKKPFPEGGYADLVSQLDNGIAYDKTTIKGAETSAEMSSPNRSDPLAAIESSLPESPPPPSGEHDTDEGQDLTSSQTAKK